ncbi:MAG: hypothetical protein Q7K57_01420 [Burkholderiaceae bacterium]|nr:hypothetical protein [Burkholderiaceae bacterium]
MHNQADSTTLAPKSVLDSLKPTVAPMLDELAQRYPSMFCGPHIGLDMAAGWYPVFVQLCADIDAQPGQSQSGEFQPGFHWRQLKEKYGQPRWYWRSKDAEDLTIDVTGQGRRRSFLLPDQKIDPISNSIQDLVQAAETRCETRCMACGNPASLQLLKGWYTTCCSEHLDMLRRDPDGFWRLVQQKPL